MVLVRCKLSIILARAFVDVHFVADIASRFHLDLMMAKAEGISIGELMAIYTLGRDVPSLHDTLKSSAATYLAAI